MSSREKITQIINNSFAIGAKDAVLLGDHIIHNKRSQSSDTLIVALFNRLSSKTN